MFTTVYALVLITALKSHLTVDVVRRYPESYLCEQEATKIKFDPANKPGSFKRYAYCTALQTLTPEPTNK